MRPISNLLPHIIGILTPYNPLKIFRKTCFEDPFNISLTLNKQILRVDLLDKFVY